MCCLQLRKSKLPSTATASNAASSQMSGINEVQSPLLPPSPVVVVSDNDSDVVVISDDVYSDAGFDPDRTVNIEMPADETIEANTWDLDDLNSVRYPASASNIEHEASSRAALLPLYRSSIETINPLAVSCFVNAKHHGNGSLISFLTVDEKSDTDDDDDYNERKNVIENIIGRLTSDAAGSSPDRAENRKTADKAIEANMSWNLDDIDELLREEMQSGTLKMLNVYVCLKCFPGPAAALDGPAYNK